MPRVREKRLADALRDQNIKQKPMFHDHRYTYDLALVSWAWDYYAMTQQLIVNPRALQATSINDVDLAWWNDLQAFKRHEKYFEES